MSRCGWRRSPCVCALYKSVRWTAGFRGTLCFTLPEALWLASLGWDDLVVGYPTVDRAALRELAPDRRASGSR